MRSTIKRLLNSLAGSFAERIALQPEVTERLLVLAGRQAAWQLRSHRTINTLEEIEFRVFSQWGEDGIIEWLVQNLPIENKSFIEFGVENYREANTRFLIENRNWRGLVIDGSEANMQALRASELHWKFDLTAVAAFITRDNINQVISENGFAGNVGILSIDIDGNDYWVFEAITCVNPSIIVCEFNPIFGDKFPVSVPYDQKFARFNAHFSGLYFGASIAAIKILAAKKGYEFVGTNSNGINAFFVRRDLFSNIAALIRERKEYPSLHRDSRDESGNLSKAGGVKRYDLIKHLPVVVVDTGRQVPLVSLAGPYSDEWLREMGTGR
jgi:hypothetical protein